MTTKAIRIEHAKQAIKNLHDALALLTEEGASDAAKATYEANLKAEQDKLSKLTGSK